MFYKEPLPAPGALTQAQQLQGKELSYNNIGDTNGALDLLREFDELAVVAVKHANPAAWRWAARLDAYTRCYNADPVSIFGGIVVTNAEVDEATAQEMTKIFLEIVVAPSYTEGAAESLQEKEESAGAAAGRRRPPEGRRVGYEAGGRRHAGAGRWTTCCWARSSRWSPSARPPRRRWPT